MVWHLLLSLLLYMYFLDAYKRWLQGEKVMLLFGGGLIIAFLVAAGYHISILIVGLLYIFMRVRKSNESKKLKRKSLMTSYRIYRYLNLLIESGLTYEKAMANLYRAVDEPDLKGKFQKFGSMYLRVNDSSVFRMLKDDVEGSELEKLVQNLMIGKDKFVGRDGFRFEEEFMQGRYFSQLKKSVHLKKNLVMLTGLLILASIVMQIIIPVFNEFKSGVGLNIF